MRVLTFRVWIVSLGTVDKITSMSGTTASLVKVSAVSFYKNRKLWRHERSYLTTLCTWILGNNCNCLNLNKHWNSNSTCKLFSSFKSRQILHIYGMWFIRITSLVSMINCQWKELYNYFHFLCTYHVHVSTFSLLKLFRDWLILIFHLTVMAFE